MKAIRIHQFGNPNVLHLEEAERPEPSDGELLIRVFAAGVNPVDSKTRSGKYRRDDTRFPATLGRDVSGVVEAVGRGVDGFKPGDAVYAFLGANSGGYAEYALAEEQEVSRKPDTLDHTHAAAVPLAAETAWQGLFDHGGLQPGERVLIHGAAGGVGHYAVQFAKARGATVVATGSADDLELLRQLGADVVIDYKSERFEERAGECDLVLDLIGGETQARSWAVLKDGGRMISTLEQPSREEAEKHHARAEVFMAKPKAEQLREIARMIDDHKVKVHLKQAVPLADAAQAHRTLENEHTQGKIVLTVDDSRHPRENA